MRIAMISIYPPPNSKHSKLGGVASYTHNLVNSYPKNGVETIVFSNKLPNIESNYTENGIIIKRCWDKGVMYPFQIFYNIFSSKVDVIHIQHEFFLYGNGVSAAFFPLLQLLLKLLNKPIMVTIHGVIPLSKLNGEFIEENKLNGNPSILKSELYLLTKLIVKLSTYTIVHEKKLKEVLQYEYKCNSSKIFVIPHGIENRKDSIENWKAKQLLGYRDKKIVLFFGYLTGYKGIELLIEAFNYLDDKDAVLIIAGGEHPRLKEEESYKNYIATLKKKATDTGKEIVFTGFVPEEKIAIYFSAADVVVCPYTVFMSSSGPLSLSLAYSRPFIVSESFKDAIGFEDIIFKNNPKELSKKIEIILNNFLKQDSLHKLDELKQGRLWSAVSKKTCETYTMFTRLGFLRNHE
jgi:glycosyltransferase involved in cell wall biosynthesis